MRKKIPLCTFTRTFSHDSSCGNGNLCLFYLVVCLAFSTCVIFYSCFPGSSAMNCTGEIPNQQSKQAHGNYPDSNNRQDVFKVYSSYKHEYQARGKKHGSG